MGGISCHGCVYVQKFVSEKNIQRLAHLDQGLLGHQQFLISAPSGSRLHNFLLMCRISSPFPLKRPKLSSKLLFQAGDFLFCCLLSFFFLAVMWVSWARGHWFTVGSALPIPRKSSPIVQRHPYTWEKGIYLIITSSCIIGATPADLSKPPGE
jgi:hypothetical protein